MRRTGWIKLFRGEEKFKKALDEVEKLKPFGLTCDILDAAGVREREPNLADDVLGAVHYRDPVCINDPAALSLAYLRLFEKRGGLFLAGDARTLAQSGSGWTIATKEGQLEARDVVVAMGPWSDLVTKPFGYDFPIAVKRGYHMHYKPAGNAVLNHTVLDAENGYVLAPMARGIRLTTGAEFADRDSAAHARAARPDGAACAPAVPARRARRPQAVGRQPALHAGHAAHHRRSAPAQGPLVRLRPRPPRPDAVGRDRPPAGRDDDGRNALHGSHALCGGALRLTTQGETMIRPKRSFQAGRLPG